LGVEFRGGSDFNFLASPTTPLLQISIEPGMIKYAKKSPD